MSKFKAFTFYKVNGTTQVFYGKTVQNALDNAGWDLDYVTKNIRDYREGFSTDLQFIKGKWYEKDSKVTISIQEINQN